MQGCLQYYSPVVLPHPQIINQQRKYSKQDKDHLKQLVMASDIFFLSNISLFKIKNINCYIFRQHWTIFLHQCNIYIRLNKLIVTAPIYYTKNNLFVNYRRKSCSIMGNNFLWQFILNPPLPLITRFIQHPITTKQYL